MLHVTNAEYLDGYRISVRFNNGQFGIVDLTDELDGPVFRPLKDIDVFQRFRIIGHTIAWENGADLAPEFLLEKIGDYATAYRQDA